MKAVFTNRSLRNLMLINFLFGAADAVFALRTVLLSSHGMSPTQIGLMFSLTSIVGTVSPLVGGWLADKVFSRYRVFLLALWGYAVVVALLPVSADVRMGATLLAMVLMPCLQVFHPTGSTLIATCSINAVSRGPVSRDANIPAVSGAVDRVAAPPYCRTSASRNTRCRPASTPAVSCFSFSIGAVSRISSASAGATTAAAICGTNSST